MARKTETGKRRTGKRQAVQIKRKLDAETDFLGKKLDALMAVARSAEAGVKGSSVQQLRLLKRKHAEVRRSVAKFARQSAAASGAMKTGLQKAWLDIETAVRQATKRFRETT
jgi:hypothetical protein